MVDRCPWPPTKGRKDLGGHENYFGRHSYASSAGLITGGLMAFRGTEEDEVQANSQSHDNRSNE